MNFDSSLTEQLALLADEPAPATSADVDRAVADGRRKAAGRKAIGAATGTAAVVGAVALAAALGTSLPGGGRSAAIAGSGSSSYSGLSGTDPLLPAASFSALPAGYLAGAQVETGQPDDIVAVDPATRTMITVTVYRAGQSVPDPHFKGAVLAPQTKAPRVDGADAYWYWVPGSVEAAQDGTIELVWEYAPDAWASLTYDSPDTSTAATPLVYQVAEHVRFGGPAAVPLPFHLTAPGKLPVTGAGYLPSTDLGHPWFAGVTFGTVGASATDVSRAKFISISVAPAVAGAEQADESADGKVGSPVPTAPTALGNPPQSTESQTTVDGYPALAQSASDGGAILRVYGVDGLDIDILVGSGAMPAVRAEGGIDTLFSSITWLGANPANWTTHVIG